MGARLRAGIPTSGLAALLLLACLTAACGSDRQSSGRLLVLDRDARTQRASISIVRADGTGRREVASGVDAAFSPDGRRVALVLEGDEVARQDDQVGHHLGVADLGTGVVTPVPLPRTGPDSSGPESVDWAPDGWRLVFTRPTRAGEEPPWELAVVGLNGRGWRVLVRSKPGRPLMHARWSPDGRWIADSLWESVIEVVRPDGTGRHRRFGNLLHTFARDPSWSPDGRQLAFGIDDDPAHIATLGASSGRPHRLTRGTGPVWSPNGRRIVYFPLSEGVPPVIIRPDGTDPRRLPLGDSLPLDWQAEPVTRPR
jgi:Tol biopolymer transport system component